MSDPITMNRINSTSNSYRYSKTTAAVNSGLFGAALQSQSEAVKTARTTDVFQMTEAQAVSTKDMTLEEYKSYISQQIDNLPRHPSQALRSESIFISDKGFEAMQNDPEYEKWVLDTLKENFTFNDPWTSICGGSYGVHYFGATKEEYRGYGWYEGYQGGKGRDIWEEKSSDSFWKHRAEQHKLNMEAFQRRQRQRAQMEDAAEQAALRREALSKYFGQVQYSRSLAARSGNLFSPDMPIMPSMPGISMSSGVSAAELLELLM